jgi:hypothetical protein
MHALGVVSARRIVMTFTALVLLVLLAEPAAGRPGGVRATGTLNDAAGRPIAGAVVRLVRKPDNGWFGSDEIPDVVPLAVSAAGGNFALAGPRSGVFDLVVFRPGLAPYHRPGIEIVDGEAVNLGRVVLADGANLSGRFSDKEGLPLAGVEIWLLDSPREAGPIAVSGPDGRFAIAGAPPGGPVELEVCGDDVIGGTYSPRPGRAFNVILLRTGRIAGRVVDEQGKPLADVEVSPATSSGLFRSDYRRCRNQASAHTDAAGRYGISTLAPGIYRVAAGASGFADLISPRVAVRGGEATPVNLVLRRGASLSGRVVGPGGSPIRGAEVTALEASGCLPRKGSTDAEGRYRLEGFAAGEAEVNVSATGFEEGSLHPTLTAGNNRLDVTLESSQAKELRGRVLGARGQPLGGAVVTCASAIKSVHTAGDGSFVLPLRIESCALSAEAPGHVETVIPPVKAPAAGIEIRLGEGTTLHGRIVSATAEELPWIKIHAVLPDGRTFSGRVEADGSYRIPHLPAAGLSVVVMAGLRGVSQEVVIPAGSRELTADFELPRLFAVSGRIAGAAGKPLAGGVTAVHLPLVIDGDAAADGTFRLTLEQGSWTIRAGAEGYYTSVDQKLEVPQTSPVVLQLDRYSTVRGRVLGAQPEEVEQVSFVGPTDRCEPFMGASVRPDNTFGPTMILECPWELVATQAPAASGVYRKVRAHVTVTHEAHDFQADLDFTPGDLTLTATLLSAPRIKTAELVRSDGSLTIGFTSIPRDSVLRFTQLRSGTYKLRLLNEDEEPVAEREVRLERDTKVTVDVK